ncbi:MAG: hypothetical protein ACLFPE_13355 [Bacteroidales bacterium]
MTRIFTPWWLFVVFPLALSAGNGNIPEGGRSAAMAHASVALSDFWSLQNNQAGLAFYPHMSAGFYFENRFLVKELSLKSGGFILPTNSGTLGAKISYFGYPKYNESKFGLAYARSFGKVLAIGLQLDYLMVTIGNDYGQKGVATFELGVLSNITENLSLGAHVFNPLHSAIADYNDERLPAIFRLGAAYRFDDKTLVTAEVEKDTEYDPVLKMGIEYRIVEAVYVRGGISTNPGTWAFGFGLNFEKLKIDFSSNFHQVLGFSPQVSMIYQFK